MNNFLSIYIFRKVFYFCIYVQLNVHLPMLYAVNIKQLSEVEGKPFTSSLNICPEACIVQGYGRAE
jgi:hypothetical protein